MLGPCSCLGINYSHPYAYTGILCQILHYWHAFELYSGLLWWFWLLQDITLDLLPQWVLFSASRFSEVGRCMRLVHILISCHLGFTGARWTTLFLCLNVIFILVKVSLVRYTLSFPTLARISWWGPCTLIIFLLSQSWCGVLLVQMWLCQFPCIHVYHGIPIGKLSSILYYLW